VKNITDDELDELYTRAGRKAEAHLTACQDAMDDTPFDTRDGEVEDPANAPFCGCNTCVVREVLMAARDEMMILVEQELIRKVLTDARRIEEGQV
jgi:hypothetical protein